MFASVSRFSAGTCVHSDLTSVSVSAGACRSSAGTSSLRYPLRTLAGSHCASVKWFRLWELGLRQGEHRRGGEERCEQGGDHLGMVGGPPARFKRERSEF